MDVCGLMFRAFWDGGNAHPIRAHTRYMVAIWNIGERIERDEKTYDVQRTECAWEGGWKRIQRSWSFFLFSPWQLILKMRDKGGQMLWADCRIEESLSQPDLSRRCHMMMRMLPEGETVSRSRREPLRGVLLASIKRDPKGNPFRDICDSRLRL